MSPRSKPAPASAQPSTGADHASRALGLILLAWAVMGVQELCLFLRETPYGTPYVGRLSSFLPAALLWNRWAALLPALPFLAFWYTRWTREVPAGTARRAHAALLTLLALAIMLDHADNELMRFMGLHLSYSVVRTYGNVSAWSGEMLELFRRDRGGAFLPFGLLLGSPVALVWGGRRLLRGAPPLPIRGRRQLVLTVLGATVVLGASRIVWPDGNRWRRVKPGLLALYGETRRRLEWGARPEEYAALAADYQRRWLAQSADTGWTFPDTAYPLLRRPTVPAVPAVPAPNIIFIQLETFRGWDVGYLRPDRGFTPTPFLDSLARAPGSATWLRHLSFGPETVNALFGAQCSIKPHQHESPTAMFTTTRFRCLPEVLRSHGWRTEVITGVDPDWDFQTFWLRQWFDSLDVPHRSEEDDRPVFRRAAQRLRQLGAAGQPFYVMVVSFSNHLPFRSREPGLDVVPSTRPDSAIWNTMCYTDEVLRECFAAIRDEPWFGHTVVAIIGDHGENLGEHDGTAAQRNGWRETVWVPLILHGRDPRLPTGYRSDVAGLLDVAPTLADLAGIREPTSWMGHSLLQPVPPARVVSGWRKTALWADRGPWSMVLDPGTGAPRLYHALEDPLQRQDLAPAWPDTAAELLRLPRLEQALVNYLLEAGRVWPGPGGADSFPERPVP